jgi:biotin-dependent carboxylase-like uncharacterized protein
MVKVIKAGFFTTLQDLGRFGFQQYGVPVSGVMDLYSAKLANALLNNDKNAAVFEITMTGPKLQFKCDTLICISGADISPQLNNASIKLNHVVKIRNGDVLSFGKLQYGFRCYLAVSGGFQTEMIMNSRSMYKNVTSQFMISEGDELTISEDNISSEISHASIKINTDHFTSKDIETYEGPEFNQLSKVQQNKLLFQEFAVSKENNRMAYQLEETLENNLKPIITSLVLPGTVQLTPAGKLIILMRNCQTTGGYPRVLQLKECTIDILAQKFTGSKIFFKVGE